MDQVLDTYKYLLNESYNMTITILDLIQGLPEIVTEHKPEPIDALPYLTIVTDVSNQLLTHTDFELNGRILVSGKRGDVIAAWGNKTLDEIVDFEKHNFKLIWSKEAIVEGDESAPFITDLVVRVLSLKDNGKSADFCVLRNRFGASSLIVNTFTKPQ